MYPYVLKLSFRNSQTPHTQRSNASQTHQQESSADNEGMVEGFVRPAVSEFCGSLLFVLITSLLGFADVNSQLSIALFEGASLFMLMCILGRFSGAHLNPAVTMSVMLSGHCRIVLGVCLVFMQFFGAFIGSMLSRLMFSDAAYIDAFHGSVLDAGLINRVQAFFLEAVLSFLICSAYLFTALDEEGTNGTLCSTTVSVARSLATFIGFRPLGQCANIARSLASSAAASIFLLDNEPWGVLYIYLFGSVTGAMLAALAYWISRPHPLDCSIVGECEGITRE